MAVIAVMLGVLGTLVTITLLVVARYLLWIRREAGLFRCKIRVTHGWLSGYGADWPKRAHRAVWARDVLILSRGIGRARMRTLAVAYAQGDVHTLRQGAVSRLGTCPVALDLVLDEGPRLEVAAAGNARDLLCGPYVVPQLPADRRP